MFEKLCYFLSGLKMTVISMIFLILSFVLMLKHIDFPFDFAIITIIISGIPIFYWGFRLLIFKKKMTASLLISIAMIAAISTGETFAAAEVAFIMALGGILEDLTIDRAKQGIVKLLNLAPKTARKINAEKEEIILATNIQKGDKIRVLTGETIPADGIILKGETSINEAVMTGEAMPVDKFIGDNVYSGTTNCSAVIEIEVKKEYENSSIQKLIALVKEAENKKAQTQRVVDKWASILIPCAIIFALLVYFITGEISRAVTILVVFCPCSLVLATPISIMAAIGHATKEGVIVKTGAALETVAKCGVFAFDKTGTITEGRLIVSDTDTFSDFSKEKMLELLASLENKSEHPIARAILDFAKSKNIKIIESLDFKNFQGKGVSANIQGINVFAGNEKFMSDNKIELNSDIKNILQKRRLEGKIALIVAVDNEIKGIISLSDVLRPTVIPFINSLKNVETVLLTGDNSHTAEYFAKQAGIKTVKSGLLPNEKSDLIKEYQTKGKTVCMVGDGVNDAIALKVADVGISMGTFGSDIAIESSDIIITGDNLNKIDRLKRLSFDCIKTIKTNIIISMCINFISLTLSALGLLVPWTGAIVHNIASIIVVLNAALLYDKKY